MFTPLIHFKFSFVYGFKYVPQHYYILKCISNFICYPSLFDMKCLLHKFPNVRGCLTLCMWAKLLQLCLTLCDPMD